MGSRAARAAVVTTMALSPPVALAGLAALAWVGCSEDDGRVGMTQVDPGGTFGAEISVTVVGRGRVYANVPDTIDCPTHCFVRRTFLASDAIEAGAGLGLVAITSSGSRFVGWRLEPDVLGTRGRGPDHCNPVKRIAAQPAIDAREISITLPYGEVVGAVPPGQESRCAGYAKVPIAYRLTATFEDEPDEVVVEPVDSGHDEVVFESQRTGAAGKEIGFTRRGDGGTGDLFWRLEKGGLSDIYYAAAPIRSSPPQERAAAVSIDVFKVGPYGAVFQTAGPELMFIPSETPQSSRFLPPPPFPCVALAIDESGAHCRTAGPGGSIYFWTTWGGGPVRIHTGLPRGEDLLAEPSRYVFTDSTFGLGMGAIRYASKTSTGDEEVSIFNPVVLGRTNPEELEHDPSGAGGGLAWLEPTNAGIVNVFATLSPWAQPSPQPTATMFGIHHVLVDPHIPSYVWFATPSEIHMVHVSGSDRRVLRTGLANVGGIAVDESYVYWTQADGRVYRALKSSLTPAKDF